MERNLLELLINELLSDVIKSAICILLGKRGNFVCFIKKPIPPVYLV